MKIGIFTDPHYSTEVTTNKTRRNTLSLGKMEEAFATFQKAGVNATFCLGDLTDPCKTHEEEEQCFAEAIALMQAQPFPIYTISGNHDYAVWKKEEFFARLGLPIPPYTVNICGKKFIFLDANYNSNMRAFDEEESHWTDSNLPPQQVEYLKNELANANCECVVVVHEVLDPNAEFRHIIKNASQVRAILEQSQKVKLVLQGHYHWGCDSMVNGIHYVTYSAMCEGEENHYYILEIE